jgi:iron complex transport system substrate-binding protein
MKHLPKAAALAAALTLLVTACGGDDNDAEDAATTTGAPATESTAATGDAATTTAAVTDEGMYPVTVDGATGPVTLDAAPSRIVSLSPTATEMLFAIGAGDQVVAVDNQSNYPAEAAAKATDLSGYTPSAEALSGYEPDLVVMEEPREGIDAQLADLDIPFWSGQAARTFDDIYAQIEQLGALTGHVGEAAALVAQMQGDIEAATADLPDREVPLTYYHELDNTYFTVGSNTFIGAVYQAAGLRNIADATEGDTDYPQLSAEFIVSQNPDLIFLADAGFGESAATVAARPGWGDLTAVTTGAIFPLDADIASRWGPRVVDFLQVVTDAIATADAATPAG